MQHVSCIPRRSWDLTKPCYKYFARFFFARWEGDAGSDLAPWQGLRARQAEEKSVRVGILQTPAAEGFPGKEALGAMQSPGACGG